MAFLALNLEISVRISFSSLDLNANELDNVFFKYTPKVLFPFVSF